ncbi:MAG: pilus assembly FimT family protein [Spirochaetota bacterium]
MMRTSPTGTRRAGAGTRRTGAAHLLGAFTLIELLVVLGILSVVLLLVGPNLASFINPARTRSFARELQSRLVYASEKAVLEQRVLLFNFDLDERTYRFTRFPEEGEGGGLSGSGTWEEAIPVGDRSLPEVSFPDGMEVLGVELIPGGAATRGNVVIPLTPTGVHAGFAIYIREEPDRVLVVRGDGFSGRIELRREESPPW